MQQICHSCTFQLSSKKFISFPKRSKPSDIKSSVFASKKQKYAKQINHIIDTLIKPHHGVMLRQVALAPRGAAHSRCDTGYVAVSRPVGAAEW
jgi:hypothetical protein